MSEIWKETCIFSPSLICFDLCNLEEQILILEESGIKMIHVDILDGHFSPSMPLGLETVKQLRRKTNLIFDAHLMASENDYFVDELLDIGVEQLVFHAESESHIDRMINRIKSKNIRAGVALKPATPLSVIDYVIEKCDTILLMLINPGYAGNLSEAQVPYAKRKIKELRNMIENRNLSTLIEVDGRISMKNIEQYGKRDVDIFVTGSTCISKNNISQSVENLNILRNKILSEK